MGGGSGLVGSIFGGGSEGASPGFLGTGRFRVKPVEIHRGAFTEQIKEQQELQESRAIQAELSEALRARARGDVESVSEKQLKAASERSVKQQRASLVGQRGRSGELGQREATRQQAEGSQALARDIGTLRSQEQLSAESALGQAIAQQRGQDIQVAEADRASLQSLEQLKVNQDIAIQQIRAGAFASSAAQRANLFKSQTSDIAQSFLSDEEAKENIKNTEGAGKDFLDKLEGSDTPSKSEESLEASKRTGGQKIDQPDVPGPTTPGGGGGGGGGIMSLASDKELKINIKGDGAKGGNSKTSESFLDKLNAVTFNYKDSENGEGQQFGIIAQDLEAAGPVGQQMVEDTDKGKQVNIAKGFGAILASQIELNARLKALESGKKKK